MERPTGRPLDSGGLAYGTIFAWKKNAEALALHATYGLTAVRERSVEQIPHLIYNFRNVPVEYRSVPLDGIMNGFICDASSSS